jgi:hypothetical protein
VLFHLIYKRDNLLVPMFTGDKPCDIAEMVEVLLS